MGVCVCEYVCACTYMRERIIFIEQCESYLKNFSGKLILLARSYVLIELWDLKFLSEGVLKLLDCGNRCRKSEI